MREGTIVKEDVMINENSSMRACGDVRACVVLALIFCHNKTMQATLFLACLLDNFYLQTTKTGNYAHNENEYK